MKKCTACGKINEDDKNFCPVCGTKLEITSTQPVNTIDEIELVNTRLRAVPQKPKNNAKYGIIIGALCALIVIMIVVIVCVVVGSKPKSQMGFDYNTPIEEQNTITIGEKRYYRPQSEKRFPDIIRFTDNYVYLEFGFQEALYYGKSTYTVSGSTITLGSVDLEKFKAGGEIVFIGERPDFPEVHIMDAGAHLEYNDTSITIVDFESYWVLEDKYFEYPEEYKDGTVHYLSDDPENTTVTAANTESSVYAKTETDTIALSETGKKLCYTDRNHSPNPAVIQIYDDHIYIIFPFFEGMYYAKADYTCSGKIITLGSVDLYMIVSGEEPTVKGIHDNFNNVHIMDAGAKLSCIDTDTLMILNFEKYWVLREDGFDFPYEFKDRMTLDLVNMPYDEVPVKKPNKSSNEPSDVVIIGDEGGEQYFYAPNGYPYGDHIYFDSNYVYLYFGYYDMLCLGRGTYTISGDIVTLGSIDLYCDLTADGEAYVHKGEAPQLHIMDAGATIEYNDNNITLKGFKPKWSLIYDLEMDSFPENYEDGSILNKFS